MEPGDLEALEALVAACEAEMTGESTVDELDDEPVATLMEPDGKIVPGLITFGMIRRARVAIDAEKRLRESIARIGDDW